MYQTVFLNISRAVVVMLLFTACRQSPAAKQKALPYYNTADFTPVFLTPAEADKKITHTIADFAFTNQHNNTINRQSVAGKIHVANFIFTSCGSICPIMTGNMKAVAKAFPNSADVAILSYSVTPWIDSVARLKAYADNNEITVNNWHFLTGKKGAIYQLARQSYFAEEDLGFTKDSTEFLHTEHVLLVDRKQRIRGIYNGTLQLEMEQLIQDIHTLLKETDDN
jgi:protein SCO1/2